jgi:hypothetical protein
LVWVRVGDLGWTDPRIGHYRRWAAIRCGSGGFERKAEPSPRQNRGVRDDSCATWATQWRRNGT